MNDIDHFRFWKRICESFVVFFDWYASVTSTLDSRKSSQSSTRQSTRSSTRKQHQEEGQSGNSTISSASSQSRSRSVYDPSDSVDISHMPLWRKKEWLKQGWISPDDLSEEELEEIKGKSVDSPPSTPSSPPKFKYRTSSPESKPPSKYSRGGLDKGYVQLFGCLALGVGGLAGMIFIMTRISSSAPLLSIFFIIVVIFIMFAAAHRITHY